MKYSLEDLEDLIDANFYENDTQDITGEVANEVCLTLVDSFADIAAPVANQELNIIMEDLDGNLEIDITHELNSQNLKVVLYNENMERIHRDKFDFKPVDNSTVTLTFYSGIPYRRSYKGYIYKAA